MEISLGTFNLCVLFCFFYLTQIKTRRNIVRNEYCFSVLHTLCVNMQSECIFLLLHEMHFRWLFTIHFEYTAFFFLCSANLFAIRSGYECCCRPRTNQWPAYCQLRQCIVYMFERMMTSSAVHRPYVWMSCTTGFKSNWKFYSILLHKHKNVWIVNEYSNDTQTHKTSFNLCLLFWSFILANDESQSKFVVFLRNSLDFFHVFVLEIPLRLH